MSMDYLAGGPLDGSVLLLASWYDPAEDRWRRRRLSLDELAHFILGAQAVRDAAQDAALAAEARVRTEHEAGLGTRLALLEARPEEVVHFTALAALPTIAAAASFTLHLTGLVPARKGDVLLAGQIVEVRPASPLPSGVEMGVPLATADGVVALPMKATVALKTGSAIAWTITALR